MINSSSIEPRCFALLRNFRDRNTMAAAPVVMPAREHAKPTGNPTFSVYPRHLPLPPLLLLSNLAAASRRRRGNRRRLRIICFSLVGVKKRRKKEKKENNRKLVRACVMRF